MSKILIAALLSSVATSGSAAVVLGRSAAPARTSSARAAASTRLLAAPTASPANFAAALPAAAPLAAARLAERVAAPVAARAAADVSASRSARAAAVSAFGAVRQVAARLQSGTSARAVEAPAALDGLYDQAAPRGEGALVAAAPSAAGVAGPANAARASGSSASPRLAPAKRRSASAVLAAVAAVPFSLVGAAPAFASSEGVFVTVMESISADFLPLALLLIGAIVAANYFGNTPWKMNPSDKADATDKGPRAIAFAATFVAIVALAAAGLYSLMTATLFGSLAFYYVFGGLYQAGKDLTSYDGRPFVAWLGVLGSLIAIVSTLILGFGGAGFAAVLTGLVSLYFGIFAYCVSRRD